MNHIKILNADGAQIDWFPDPILPRFAVVLHYGMDVSFEVIAPRGKPRLDYPRYSIVLHAGITKDEALKIFAENFEKRRSVIYSYDDAGVGDLSDVTAELINVGTRQSEFRAWYALNYPGVKVIFNG